MYYVTKSAGVVRLSSGYQSFNVDINGVVVGLEDYPDVARQLVASGEVVQMKGKPTKKNSTDAEQKSDD